MTYHWFKMKMRSNAIFNAHDLVYVAGVVNRCHRETWVLPSTLHHLGQVACVGSMLHSLWCFALLKSTKLILLMRMIKSKRSTPFSERGRRWWKRLQLKQISWTKQVNQKRRKRNSRRRINKAHKKWKIIIRDPHVVRGIAFNSGVRNALNRTEKLWIINSNAFYRFYVPYKMNLLLQIFFWHVFSEFYCEFGFRYWFLELCLIFCLFTH